MTSITLSGSGSIGDIAPGWVVTEEATPHVPGDTSGSVGSASITAKATSTSRYVTSNPFTLTHPDLGSWSGTVDSVTLQGLTADVGVVGSLEPLVANVSAPPMGAFSEVVTSFGSFGTGNGKFQNPGDIAVDSSGNVFVADRENYRVQKFVPDGSGGFTYSTQTAYSTSGSANGQFGTGPNYKGPGYIAIDSSGRVYVTDPLNNRVQRFTNNLVYSTKWGTSGSGDGQFTTPFGLAIDSSNYIYVFDYNYRIQKFDSTLTFVAKWGTNGLADNQFGDVYGLAVGPAGNIYAADNGIPGSRVQKIKIYTNTGTFVDSIELGAPTNPAYGSSPTSVDGVAVDSSGNIYVTDFLNNRVQRFDSSLVYTGQFGSYGTGRDQSLTLRGIGVDAAGLIYVSDYTSNRVTVFQYPASSTVSLSAVYDSYIKLAIPAFAGVTWEAASDPDVVVPAWTGNLWAKLKELGNAYGLELVYAGGQTIVRDIATAGRALEIPDRTPVRTVPTAGDGGKVIRVVVQNPSAVEGGSFFSLPDNESFAVPLTGSVVFTRTTSNSPASLYQPAPGGELGVAVGQYLVTDSSGSVVSPAAWLAAGGLVKISAGDLGVVQITIVGVSSISGYTAPFVISEMNIMGAGIITDARNVDVLTSSESDEEIALTWDCPFVATVDQAYTRGGWAAARAAGPNVEIQFDVPSSKLYGFGDDVGRLVTFEGSIYRIIRVDYGNLSSHITADRYTTIGNVDSAWSGETVGTRDNFWSGYSAGDRQIQPVLTTR